MRASRRTGDDVGMQLGFLLLRLVLLLVRLELGEMQRMRGERVLDGGRDLRREV